MDLSYPVIDLISKLLTDPEKRLGRKGAEDIKAHQWFRNVDWKRVKDVQPPFKPDLISKIDTKYFDQYQ